MFRYTGEIEGMMCEKCEARMEKTLQTVFSGKKVRFTDRKAVSFLSEQQLTQAQWEKAVTDTGYKPGALHCEEVHSFLGKLFS